MSISYDHITLRSSQLERSIQFYGEILGFEPVNRRILPDGLTDQAAFRVGDLMLVLFSRPEFHQPGDDDTIGMDHLALTMDAPTYEHVLGRLRDRDLILRGPVQNAGSYGRGLATYFQDPDGNEIELKTYDPDLLSRHPELDIGPVVRRG